MAVMVNRYVASTLASVGCDAHTVENLRMENRLYSDEKWCPGRHRFISFISSPNGTNEDADIAADTATAAFVNVDAGAVVLIGLYAQFLGRKRNPLLSHLGAKNVSIYLRLNV